jgi:alanine dehydrogenase
LIVGVPKEIKTEEHRVAITPIGVRELADRGHRVLIETGAGEGSTLTDEEFEAQGATIVAGAADVFDAADLILKVKEPQTSEIEMFREGQILFTYLHLAADAPQALGLIASGVTAIAYETVTDADGHLPLLAPMSEVAGRLAIQAAATALEMPHGGRGVLLGGVRASRRARWSSSAAASSAPRRRAWPSASAPP